ncbi:hypothetical protein PJF56_17930 [Roseofilum sp. BLCC_M91]|uniref:Uncharacterized protein n=1 Tax=Roseofilum halophilum BLCC-M91 TaxID=3022259 RepID=A0ABT7BPS2_9CYAN|nr:hypothetical protein [Roseofilum halophilum]MDJ1180742.1 hypothetical protein [Roseofilum halophilum BLCC-M91]
MGSGHGGRSPMADPLICIVREVSPDGDRPVVGAIAPIDSRIL